MEDIIDRLQGTAKHPRTVERVPTGAQFYLEIVVNFYEGDKRTELLQTLFEGLRLLEDDYIGGSGSRGYGKVLFRDLIVTYKRRDDYETENERHELIQKDILQNINLEELLEKTKAAFEQKVG